MKFINGNFRIIFLLLFLTNVSTHGNNLSDPEVLKVALLPDENAAKIIQDNTDLKNHLELKLDKRVELVVTTDYSSMIEAIRFKRIHLGYFGPFSYTIAKSKTNIIPFAAREKKGNTKYRSVIIGNKGKGIKSINDIRNVDFAFGDIASTSSHLIPKKILLDHDLEPKIDYNEIFLGSHDAVAISVQNGVTDAGGLSEPILEMLFEKKLLDQSKINIIKYSEFYPQYPWVFIEDLDKSLKNKISSVFYEIKDEKILSNFKADKFSPIFDSDYDIIRELSKELDLYDFKKRN